MAWATPAFNFLKEWQTLATGVIAFAGAYWTVRAIRDQINQTEALEQKRRSSESLAARVVLPLALSELTDYARRCFNLLITYVPADRSTPALPAKLDVPSVPTDVINTIQACVRYAEPRITLQIAALLSKVQVQQSRLRALISEAVSSDEKIIFRHEGIGALVDAADVFAKASALYEYGREIANARTYAPQGKILETIHNLGVYDDHLELFEAVQRLPE
jgi:hypothetical protein